MIDYDICLCETQDCPRYSKCLRGGGIKRPPGIYTVSFFGVVCNELNNYAEFIEVENGRKSDD